MKPWPAELLRRYPLNPREGRCPERPWWVFDGSYWMRGPTTSGEDRYTVQPKVDKQASPEAKCADYASCLDEMKQVDAFHPLRHPGFRVGQVWAFPHEWHIARNRTTEDGFCVVAVVKANVTKESTYFRLSENPLFQSDDSDFDDHDGGEILAAEAYLIADPCCPHLAPWSPA